MATLRKIYIPLDGSERSALAQLAIRERRDPRAQAALIIRRELEKLGLLPTDTAPGAARAEPGPEEVQREAQPA